MSQLNKYFSFLLFTMLLVLGGTLLGSVLFFLITNFAVWLFSGMYSLTGSGLAQSYLMAIPFFRNSLLGDLFYMALLVGGYETAVFFIFKRKRGLNAIKLLNR